MPGCPNEGDHKAPKHRGLNDYYLFCTNHIKEYNKAWDFFSGMSNSEVQSQMHKSRYGDRPTWKHTEINMEEELLNAARNTYFYGDHSSPPNDKEYNDNKRKFAGDRNTPEYEAMALMGLEPPVTLDEIKTRYKKLAKKYHPDLNRDTPNAEELLKEINMAYTILKLALKDYEALQENQ
ncbi:MAG: molecular chaperone DnaJ [Alphaproteobacteria bacterium]|nr:MAG: molecular chaperone DnaJ [Alphaproteobacteria bacterium]